MLSDAQVKKELEETAEHNEGLLALQEDSARKNRKTSRRGSDNSGGDDSLIDGMKDHQKLVKGQDNSAEYP